MRITHKFADAVLQRLKPEHMPCKPFTADELKAMQGNFASRRGLPSVTLACDVCIPMCNEG